MERDRRGRDGKRGLKSSLAAGIAAFVFLIIGYQAALFIHKASVLKILGNRDSPDTVFVIDKALAGTILKSVPEESLGSCEKPVRGRPSYVIRKESGHSPEVRSVREKSSPISVESFRFNPNTVPVADLVRLGFSERQANAIDNYRKKGGRFRRKSDFAESFVVADSVYRRLEPYIDIPLIDLNLADSAAFDSLPGIGGYFASRMLEFRERLGGTYSCKEQLMDIYRFDREKYDALSDLIAVDTANIRPYRLWSLPADSLKLHPYIGSYAARGIVIYRENNPVSQWTVEGLEKAGVLKPEMARKLEDCVIAAP